MNASSIILKRTDSGNADFQSLVALLDDELTVRDGEEHAFYAQFNKANIKNAVVCYAGDKPIGCGAFREYDKEKVEIKRMYVLPGYRSHGTGLKILKELESWISELNYPSCILETGQRQPEAIRLYQKAGYSPTENFGQYQGDYNSVCMIKIL